MPLLADLHVHTRYSRATSAECDLEHLAVHAQRKGLGLLGTGDLTHPAWRAQLHDKLRPVGPGVYRLADDLLRPLSRLVPPSCAADVRFLLTGEISTIYKKDGRTRKVHHLVVLPDLAAADRFSQALSRIGNLGSDGRPILGLDSRHLLEITLESGEGAFLVPAHIWTPWFSVLGSKSGFDAVEDCYGDLASHVFAVETGLSSDPAMNRRVSRLDRYRLLSCSDAHSPGRLGREATVFTGAADFPSVRGALATGTGYGGTLEFFPEEGKYHLDGHRACEVVLEPERTRALQGLCPTCGKPLTVGVLSRVMELADRSQDQVRVDAPVWSLVPLEEILSEVRGAGVGSRAVQDLYERMLHTLGPELPLLMEVPLEDVARVAGPLVAEALSRLRRQEVVRQGGYDGEYGVIRLFKQGELDGIPRDLWLFPQPATPAELLAAPAAPRKEPAPVGPASPDPAGSPGPESPLFPDVGLDPDQEKAASAPGPLLVVAGPGSGKTRVLAHRLARLAARGEPGLALTFTRRAAREVAERIQALRPGAPVQVDTFHGWGLGFLRQHHGLLGLPADLKVADRESRVLLLATTLDLSERRSSSILEKISEARRTASPPPPEWPPLEKALRARGWVDLDDLVDLPARALQADPALRASTAARYPHVCVDEYQDVDQAQVRLLRLLCPPGSDICAIGDPDQSIYGFRGADVGLFHAFSEHFPGTTTVRLERNYRSALPIVEASRGLMGAHARAVRADGLRVAVHEAPTARAEAEHVVVAIEALLGGHTFFSVDSGRAGEAALEGLGFGDIAVLYRADALAPDLMEALHRSGIPYQKRSHDRLLDRPEVRELLAHLAPGATDIQAGLDRALEACLAPGADAPLRAALVQAREMLGVVARAHPQDPVAFHGDLALGMGADAWDPRAQRVSLLTLHAAKGLEFRVVFLVGCDDGILPLRIGGRTDFDEEKRLFYVGMTRAMDRLVLTRARQRLSRGKPLTTEPSPFLASLGEPWLERVEPDLKPRKREEEDRQLRLF